MDEKKEKAPAWAWWLSGGIAIAITLIIIITTTPESKTEEDKTFSAKSTYQICDNDGEHDFSNLDVKKVGKVDVPVRQDCWTRIVLPMNACWRTSPTIDVIVLLPNGEQIIDGPGRITPGVNNIRFFSVRALSQSGTMPIIFDDI